MPDRGVLGTRGLVVGWAGQSGVLAPGDVTAVAAPGFVGNFPPLATWALDIVKRLGASLVSGILIL